MDFLKAEIAKRKAESEAQGARAAKQARTTDTAPAQQPSTANAASPSPLAAAPSPSTVAAAATSVAAEEAEAGKPEVFNISNEDAVRRLRQKGQPIRLFGENDRDRRLRVRALELIEERTQGQQRNDFMKTLERMEQGLDVAHLRGERASTPVGRSPRPGTPGTPGVEEDASDTKEQADTPVDMSLVKSKPHKVYPQIYWAFKRMLREWEQAMDERPEDVKRTTQGKLAAATQSQSADYLKPLFKQLRKRDLEADVLQSIAEIASSMQKREYVKANDAYLRLSIGNSPWPIGVTMVGIHERKAREKIFSNSVAHVLNDEVSRKYIQSLKRLLTFAQAKYPPFDSSQRMG